MSDTEAPSAPVVAAEQPAFDFAPVRKTAIDLFARAPQVKKMSRRDKHRLAMEELTKSGGASKDKKKGESDDVFQTVFSPEEDADAAEKKSKKGKQRRQVLRHALHANDEEDVRTVFVGNLPNIVKKREVERVFKDCGAIECVRVRCQALEPGTEQSKNAGRAVRVLRGEVKKDAKYSATAYVLFKDRGCVATALKKNGIVFGGRHLVVTTMDAEGRAYAPETSIFIGNVSYDTTEEDVWNFFASHGISDVKRVRLIRDRDSGDCKGFGYVEFMSAASVSPAIATRGNQLNGRDLRIVHVNKSKDVKAVTSSRRDSRKDAKATTAGGAAGKKRARSGDGRSDAGRDDRRKSDVPSWMGVTTNPRKKMPRDLRPLVADGLQHKPRSGGRPPVKRKMRNPEK